MYDNRISIFFSNNVLIDGLHSWFTFSCSAGAKGFDPALSCLKVSLDFVV